MWVTNKQKHNQKNALNAVPAIFLPHFSPILLANLEQQPVLNCGHFPPHVFGHCSKQEIAALNKQWFHENMFIKFLNSWISKQSKLSNIYLWTINCTLNWGLSIPENIKVKLDHFYRCTLQMNFAELSKGTIQCTSIICITAGFI